jgi:hypothetical protein
VRRPTRRLLSGVSSLSQVVACHSNRALCLHKLGDARGCEASAAAALALDSAHVKARWWRVHGRLARGDTQGAAEDVWVLLQALPQHREARALLEATCVPSTPPVSSL